MKFLGSLFLTAVLFLSLSTRAFAFDMPQFSSCLNPQGNLKVSYDAGTHGIAGKTETYTGSDSVYTLSADSLTQCFCADNGSGIQTNWWKVSSLTDRETESLKSQGWVYVPSGAMWGLDSDPYLAFNLDYVCKSSGSGGSGGFSPTTDIPGPGGNGGQGSILGDTVVGAGSVLGLASTGNSKLLYGTALLSVLLFVSGLYLKLRAKKLSN